MKLNLTEFLQPRIQLFAKIFPVEKISVQINFREEQRNILKIFPMQTAALFSDMASVPTNIFVIQPKFFRRDVRISHSAEVRKVFVKIGVAAFVDAFIICAV